MAVGEALYEKFFYHYTKKMWGCDPKELPSDIIERIPVRTDYRTSYYNDRYVAVPINGYSNFICKLLDGVGIEVECGDFCKDRHAGRKVFTGSIDEYHKYELGFLPYRGLLFEEVDEIDAMVINYTDSRPYTRDVNYSYLGYRDITIRETPIDHRRMYPTPRGKALYRHYSKLRTDVEFAGRLGSYKYLNMNEVIEQAYAKSKTL